MPGVTNDLPFENQLLAKDGGEGDKEPGSVLIPQASAPALFCLFPGIWLQQKNGATWVSVLCGYTDICYTSVPRPIRNAALHAWYPEGSS